MIFRFSWFLLFFLTCLQAYATNLVINIDEKLPDEIQQNIKGYLGDLPNDAIERLAFIDFSKEKVTKALQALGYYRSSVIITTDKIKNSEQWILNVQIKLNSPTLVNSINVNLIGDANNDQAFTQLLSHELIKEGDVLHHGNYEKIKSDLTSLGLARGYFDGKISEGKIAINQKFDVADIVITYDSGIRYQLGEVSFSAFDIEPSVLNALVPFEYGDEFINSDIQLFQNNLERSQYFKSILVIPNKDKAIDGVIPVDVSLEKNKSHFFDFGIGYATDTEFRLSAGWRTPLVNRLGHHQETNIRYSRINPSGTATYSIPLSHPLDDLWRFQLEMEDDTYGGIDSKYWSAETGRMQNRDGLIRQYYIKFLNEEWDVDNLNDDAQYWLPGITWSKTVRKGSHVDPSEGFRQYYNIEGTHTAWGSEISFVRFNAKWKYLTTFNEKHRLVARAEAGYAFLEDGELNEMAPSLRFFAGGDQSIRGFSYQSVGPSKTIYQDDGSTEKIVVGGTNMVVGSLEYQYYFLKEWRLAAFIDGGTVRDSGNKDTAYSIGPGIHYISPVGAIRVDLGYSLSEDDPSWRIHISLGTEL